MNILSNTYYKTLYNSLTKLIDVNKIENEIGDNSFFVASTPNNKRLTLIINYLTSIIFFVAEKLSALIV